jgi:hypothetical protein
VALLLPEEPIFSLPPRECSSEPDSDADFQVPDPKRSAYNSDLPLALLDFALHIGEDEVTVEVEGDSGKRYRSKEKKNKLEAGTGTGGSRLRRSPILRSSGNRKRFVGCVNQVNILSLFSEN